MALGGLLLAGWFSCIIDWPFYVPTEFFLFPSLLFFPRQGCVGEKQHGVIENAQQMQ